MAGKREPEQDDQSGGTDDQGEPDKPAKPRAPKRGDFERLMNRAAKQPAKQRQAPVKPPPQRHQRRGR
jgi:hypothetical protein